MGVQTHFEDDVTAGQFRFFIANPDLARLIESEDHQVVVDSLLDLEGVPSEDSRARNDEVFFGTDAAVRRHWYDLMKACAAGYGVELDIDGVHSSRLVQHP